MDQTNSFGINQTYRLLALCARADEHPIFYEQLAHQINQFKAWQELPFEAELHGMAALLWHHIHRSGIGIPEETARILQGLYLRQRSFNQIYTLALIDIISLFEKNGIRALVLKGLALAHEYYPDPALRSLSDIDLLFKQEDVLPALRLLADAGFYTRFPDSTLKRVPTELTADSPLKDGISVHVELHHYDPKGRYEKGNSPDPEFKNFHAPPQIVTIGKNIIYTSTYMETLYYLSRHFTKHLLIGNSRSPAQLKWIADIVSLIERRAKEIDWQHLQQHHPDILSRLEVIYSLTPLPERLTGIIPVGQITPPTGIGQYPPGWPHQSVREWRKVGYLRSVLRIFIPPSNWWLQLYYGINEKRLFWYKHVVYRAQVFSALFWTALHKMGI